MHLHDHQQDTLLNLDVPLWDNTYSKRCVRKMPVRLPSQALAEIFKTSPESVLPKHQDAIEYRIDSFMQHPVVHLHGPEELLDKQILHTLPGTSFYRHPNLL